MLPDQRGFALLEVLIAFAIAAIALVVLYRGGSEGIQNARQAARVNEAVSRARSRLAVACHGQPLVPEVRSGDDGGVGTIWSLRRRMNVKRSIREITPRAASARSPGTR